MNSKRAPPLMLVLSLFAILCIAVAAQDRAPHGLTYENPMVFPPTAYDFFHPDTQQENRNKPCGVVAGCLPLPMAAQIAGAKESWEGTDPTIHSGGKRIAAGTVVSIVIGLTILAMTVCHIIATHQASKITSNQKPDVG